MSAPELTPDQFRVILDWPVQWGDQDLNGHVNNVIYIRWLESARVEYLNRLGIPMLYGKRDFGPILAQVSCNFRRQLDFPDTVRIGTRVSRIGRTSIVIEHAIWSTRNPGPPVADASSVVVVFDYNAQKPKPVPDDIRRQIEQLEGKRFE